MNKAEWEEIEKVIEHRPYLERRRFLRHKVAPRYPRFLYKYRRVVTDPGEKIDALRDILVESKLYQSSPLSFNDPFDVRAATIAQAPQAVRWARFQALVDEHQAALPVSERVAEVQRLTGMPDAHWAVQAEQAFLKSAAGLGVVSFCTRPRNILMWSHYASNHSGVCVQFEIAQNPTTFLHAIPVEYNDEFPVLNWFGDMQKELVPAVLRKHTGWRYEDERRIINPGQAGKYIFFKPLSVSALILGAKCEGETKDCVMALIRQRVAAGLPRVRLFRAVLDKTRYRLTLHRVR